MLEILRGRGAAEAARDREGAPVIVVDAPDRPLLVRARAAEVAAAFRSPRPIAALGEEGLRAALREALRLETDLAGEGLTPGFVKHDRGVVYATYEVTPTGGIGERVKKIRAWCDGTLLLIEMKRR
jgi:hypothetical protein